MRDESEIETELNEAIVRSIEPSRFPGMTYEQGVKDALGWVLDEGLDAKSPMAAE